MKARYPVDKRLWHPSLIPGAIVLISTYDSEKKPNIAPKSFIQMISFEPSILMFSTSKNTTTATNIDQNKAFCVNFVDYSLADTVFNCLSWYGDERIREMDLKLSDSEQVFAPIVDDCPANLECSVIDTREYGSGYAVFAEIVGAWIDDPILQVEPDERYELLDQIVFLEDGVYQRINNVSKANYTSSS